MASPVKLTPGWAHGHWVVTERSTGTILGTVAKRSEYGIISWSAARADDARLNGPLSRGHWHTRRIAALMLLAAHRGVTPESGRRIDIDRLCDELEGA